MMAWFGICGVGSLYYLLYYPHHDIAALLAKQLLSITLATVVASVLSVAPLMKRYAAGKKTL